jgi:PAS domain S-box-containing protein/putative nucleotidyltransferase with HDIG domain
MGDGETNGKPAKSDGAGLWAERALTDHEEQYRLIVDTAYEGICVLDKDYTTTFVNRRMADMLGYERHEMVGRPHAAFFFPEDLPDLAEKQERRRRGIAEHYERRLRRKDGTTVWTHASTTPILDEEGRFLGSFAMFTDVTERKKAQEALLESEAKYRSIFENAVEGMFQSTPDGGLMTVNPAMARTFGYASPEEMVSRVANIGRQLYTNAEDRQAFTCLLEQSGIAEGFEARFYRKDGTTLWGSLNVRAVKDRGGAVAYYEGTLVDITSRKEAEEALLKSEAKYRDIFENAVEGIFQITPDGRYLSVNPALVEIHGFTSPEEMVQSVTDIALQLYVDPTRRAELMRRVNEEGFVKNFEIIMRRKDGRLQWVSINSRGVRDGRGNILYYEGTLQDITSRKFAEEELKQLKKTLAGTIDAFVLTVEVHDPGTCGHQRRVARLAQVIAREMGLSEDTAETIRLAGLVHDVGKIAVPGEILSRPGTLSDAEYHLVKVHPQKGYDILRDAGLPYPAAETVLQHHERLDGSGYPAGLKGTEILLEGRILAVADVVEAMTSPRPHRPGLSIDEALGEIGDRKGVLYDPGAVDVCLRLFREKGFRLD